MVLEEEKGGGQRGQQVAVFTDNVCTLFTPVSEDGLTIINSNILSSVV